MLHYFLYFSEFLGHLITKGGGGESARLNNCSLQKSRPRVCTCFFRRRGACEAATWRQGGPGRHTAERGKAGPTGRLAWGPRRGRTEGQWRDDRGLAAGSGDRNKTLPRAEGWACAPPGARAELCTCRVLSESDQGASKATVAGSTPRGTVGRARQHPRASRAGGHDGSFPEGPRRNTSSYEAQGGRRYAPHQVVRGQGAPPASARARRALRTGRRLIRGKAPFPMAAADAESQGARGEPPPPATHPTGVSQPVLVRKPRAVSDRSSHWPCPGGRGKRGRNDSEGRAQLFQLLRERRPESPVTRAQPTVTTGEGHQGPRAKDPHSLNNGGRHRVGQRM